MRLLKELQAKALIYSLYSLRQHAGRVSAKGVAFFVGLGAGFGLLRPRAVAGADRGYRRKRAPGVTRLWEVGDITFGDGGVVYSSCLILRSLAGGSRRSEELAAALRARKRERWIV